MNKKPWWKGKYVLWFFMMLPGLLLAIGILSGDGSGYSNSMHITGELSGRFLLLSLIASPLILLFPKARFPKWLNRNKRYLGLAAFFYALFHAIVYLVKVPVDTIVKEFFDLGLLSAWLSFMIWIPMAITSTDGWMRQLKSTWKKIHYWGYLAALLAYLHWALIHNHWAPALVHAVPVMLLQGYRWGRYFSNRLA